MNKIDSKRLPFRWKGKYAFRIVTRTHPSAEVKSPSEVSIAGGHQCTGHKTVEHVPTLCAVPATRKETKPVDEEFYAYDAGLGVKWPANKFVCVPGAPMKFLPVRPLKPAIKMAELFSGTARLSASFACLGVEAWAWDILYGPGGDLTSGRVLKDLKERIRKKEFTVVTFALQCSSWSRARKNDGKGPRAAQFVRKRPEKGGRCKSNARRNAPSVGNLPSGRGDGTVRESS